MSDRKIRPGALILTVAVALASCAPLQPPDATGPRGNEPVYPVLFLRDDKRLEAAEAAMTRLVQPDNAVKPQLQPITATIESFPADAGRPLYLPKLGAAAVMNEEENRESLRRFIRDWQELIGAAPDKLSLIERLDQPDGTKLASYEQRPFRYPIRGQYGKLQIRFTTDRRVLNISSTCIPDADRMQTALAAISVRVKPEDAITKLRDNQISYTDTRGIPVSFRLPATSEINPRELVTYILASKSQPDRLEFHIAWEIEVSNAPVKKVYLDAVNGETIAAE